MSLAPFPSHDENTHRIFGGKCCAKCQANDIARVLTYQMSTGFAKIQKAEFVHLVSFSQPTNRPPADLKHDCAPQTR